MIPRWRCFCCFVGCLVFSLCLLWISFVDWCQNNVFFFFYVKFTGSLDHWIIGSQLKCLGYPMVHCLLMWVQMFIGTLLVGDSLVQRFTVYWFTMVHYFTGSLAHWYKIFIGVWYIGTFVLVQVWWFKLHWDNSS